MTFLIIFLLILAAVFLFWGTFIEPRMIRVEKLNLEIKNLPSSFHNARIIQLSDIHSKRFGKREEKIIKAVNKINPDFVFITGDFLSWGFFGRGINSSSFIKIHPILYQLS